MSRIKGKDTTPELRVRKALFAKGYRYRIHDKNLPGKPDIVLKRYKTVIFVHGCFWHQHADCISGRAPKSNVDFWEKKLTANKTRDESIKAQLETAGWKTIVVWECETKPKQMNELLNRILEELVKDK